MPFILSSVLILQKRHCYSHADLRFDHYDNRMNENASKTIFSTFHIKSLASDICSIHYHVLVKYIL